MAAGTESDLDAEAENGAEGMVSLRCSLDPQHFY